MGQCSHKKVGAYRPYSDLDAERHPATTLEECTRAKTQKIIVEDKMMIAPDVEDASHTPI